MGQAEDKRVGVAADAADERTPKDPLAVEMGERVRQAIEEAGLSIKGTARLLGVDPDTFGGAVRGYHRLQYETLVSLSRLLHRSLEYFFGMPLPEGLSAEEDELVNIFRAFRTRSFRAALLHHARDVLQQERELSGDSV